MRMSSSNLVRGKRAGSVDAMATRGAGEVRGYGARSLGLLQAIEDTVSGLTHQAELFRLMASHAQDIERRLVEAAPAEVIDPEGSIATQFNGAADALKRLHERARKALASAKADPALHPDDGVVAAFEAAIDATAAYFNAIESLRDTFETLDALKSPLTGKTYTDADVLIADLLRG